MPRSGCYFVARGLRFINIGSIMPLRWPCRYHERSAVSPYPNKVPPSTEDCQTRTQVDLFQQTCDVVIFQQNNNAQHVQIMESPGTWQTPPFLPLMPQVSISRSSHRTSKSSEDMSGNV